MNYFSCHSQRKNTLGNYAGRKWPKKVRSEAIVDGRQGEALKYVEIQSYLVVQTQGKDIKTI